jgi:hypothetical protein
MLMRIGGYEQQVVAVMAMTLPIDHSRVDELAEQLKAQPYADLGRTRGCCNNISRAGRARYTCTHTTTCEGHQPPLPKLRLGERDWRGPHRWLLGAQC